MKTWKVTILAVTTALIISACSNSPIYYPELAQTPLFTKKNQLDVNVAINGVERGQSINIAYSISDQTFMSGLYARSRLSNCRTCTTSIRNYTELTFGRYNTENILNISEIMIGVGEGDAKSLDALPFQKKQTVLVLSDYYRVYMQANWLEKGRRIDKIVSLRTSYLTLNNYQELSSEDMDVTPSGRNYSFYIEPAITFKFKFKINPLFFNTQLGFSIPVLFDSKFQHDWVVLIGTIGYRFNQ